MTPEREVAPIDCLEQWNVAPAATVWQGGRGGGSVHVDEGPRYGSQSWGPAGGSVF
jgi:hypothetical protein